MMEKERKILYSAMQPSGVPSLGNYLGALKNWKNLQKDYDCIFGVANMHAITVRQNPAEFRKRIRDLLRSPAASRRTRCSPTSGPASPATRSRNTSASQTPSR